MEVQITCSENQMSVMAAKDVFIVIQITNIKLGMHCHFIGRNAFEKEKLLQNGNFTEDACLLKFSYMIVYFSLMDLL